MKTLVLGFLFLGLTSLTFSQNDIAYTNVSSEIKFEASKKETINVSFIKSFETVDLSKRIISFQKVAANYDIKTDPVYMSNKPTTYAVVFKEANNKIENLYNHSGEILSSNQIFSDIRLPYAISSKITIEHPGWSIYNVKCTIAYIQDEAVNIAYKVKLKNGNQSKVLKIKG
ncbi:hypothetical protein [Ichthyenterobacterium magnum]|uniref:Uncharacterized protein n=1 Tax=Ichthyenterobacterium magnum TaxID=1230530 RepID=A0A420DM93_9FLAO|nr:hypothetical protein [Ichthyenterobacterium magnum]RKE95362.1 hypothetical protein BXY80_1549 [Ichthyenterobacterium magnum]